MAIIHTHSGLFTDVEFVRTSSHVEFLNIILKQFLQNSISNIVLLPYIIFVEYLISGL